VLVYCTIQGFLFKKTKMHDIYISVRSYLMYNWLGSKTWQMKIVYAMKL